ncbi:uncharacterized protein LOC134827523 [Culicoides brevitarsis]|uniref:uncharacterized protein LOC134827523 n=1 Tax=Culicoides brevitarsis TaxID=469753 RepID=UPI00307C826F
MKISREEYKNIRYICKKFNISPESFRIKTLAATLDKRLLRRRFVLCFAVKHTRKGHFLVWNSLKRIDIRDKFLKKNAQNRKHKHIKWRRAVRKVRKLEPIKTEEQEEPLEENEIETQEVRDKLKEQLQLLQQGKKNKLIEETSSDPVCNGTAHSPKSSKCSENGMNGECFDDLDDMESLRVTPDITSECEEKELVDHKTPVKENDVKSDSEHEETPKLSDTGYNSPAVTPSKKGFLDSLLNKFKTTDVITEKPTTRASKKAKETIVEEEIVDEEMLPEPILVPMAIEPEPRTTRMRARKTIHQIKKEPEDSTKNDLFKLGEKDVPGLLATPKAKNTKVSAFVDQETAAEVKIKLEKLDDDSNNFDQKEHEGLVCSGIKPPHLEKPKKFMDLERPRTVYEKRQLMQKKKGIQFLMMENESKIYNELAKINREDYDYQFNFPMLTALQKETVPYRRDAWRALSFLKTEKNRFFYKVLFIDGVKCNLLGSRGNFDGKKKFKTTSSPFPKYLAYKNKNPCCKPIKMPKNVKFNLNIPQANAEQEQHTTSKKLLDYDKTMLNMKPAPLSVKLRKQTSRLSTDECLGPLELYTMPTVELEVHPKVGRQLDPKIHPYLKYLLPYENITETWARFSVSLLKKDEKDIDGDEKKFSFPIPYSNNQNKIMVRRRKEIAHSTNISIEDKELAEDLEKPLTFTNVIKPNDKLGQEIADILTEMTNSVAIGLSESSFIQNDPDLDYTQNDKPLEVAPVKAVKETVLSKKIVRELRKLNATFITAAENPTTKCSEKYCEQGCVCESLSTSLVFKNHCKKQDCMIECNCASNRFHQEDIKDCNFTSDEVQSLREKATARLAPMEKDFTPTLVLSNNSTYLIPGSDREHSRRSKKVPARYSDYVDPSKTSIAADESSEIVPLTELTKTKYTPKDPLEAAVFQMKHCNVVLRPLNHVSQIEPWCMVHRLYKCFCNGQAVEGRPFTFDDVEEGLMERYEYGNRKPRYEFERNDARMPLKRDRRTSSGANSTNTSPSAKIRRTSSGMMDLDSLDLVRIDTNTAQRCFPIDRKYIKRDPRETNLKKTAIKKYEEKHSYTEALLKKRLEECERHFHRELRRKLEQTDKKALEQEVTTEEDDATEEQDDSMGKNKRVKKLTRPIRLNIRNSPEEIMTISMLKPLITKNVILVATGKNKIYAKKDYFYAGKLDFTKVLKKTKNTIFIIEKTDEEVANCSDFLRFNPLIRRTKLVDLKLIINIILQPENEKANNFSFDLASQHEQGVQEETEKEEIPSSQGTLAIEPSDVASEIGKKKVQHINTMISKAMQYICKLQKQNSPTLVEPTQSKMYFFTWRCMIQGFQQGLLSVWEIRCIGNRCAVVVTQAGNYPTIEYLEEIKNIRDCTVETPGLSLYSKMLLLKVENEKTKNLSLVLYGGINFWRITGFVNSETNYQQHGIIARPTPQTHPVLSAKINHLFNMLHHRRESEINFDEVPVEKKEKAPVKPPVYKTNIKICSTENMPSIRSLFLPIPEVAHQRWFMLQIENDFSDIFIPNWEDYLSYDKVTYALQLAKTHSKTVRVTMNDKFPEIYATPRRSNCIFFGPYSMKSDIDYVLCQNVDGKIIDRETYEEKYKVKRDRATIGSWLYPKKDGDSTSPEGEPSPKVRKVIVKKKSLDKTNSEKLPFVISQVQTAITDPKLIPKNESSDEENTAKRLVLKRVSREMINNDLKRQKLENPTNPLKVTLLKKAGEGGYAIKPGTGLKPVQVVKRTSLPETGITDHKLTGKRISLPLSAVKSMKTMMLQKGVKLMKTAPTVVANQTQVKPVGQNSALSDKPSTSKELIRPNVVKRLAIKTNSGVQITSVVRNTEETESKKVNDVPPPPVIKIEKTPVDNKKVQNIQKTLPSAITVRSLTPDQNKKDSSAMPAIKTVTIKPSSTDAKTTLPAKSQVVIKKEDEKSVPVTNKLSTNSTTSTASTVSATETDVVHGFYISNVIAIGRIIAEKRVNKLILKMRNSDGYYVRRQFMTGQSILYLNRYLRGLVHSFIPENFMLNWRFETNKEIVDKYPEHDPNKVPRKMIITRQGGISLKQSWDQLAYLEKYDKNQYLKILLIKLAEDCFPEQKFTNWDVLQILQTSQKEILDLETKSLRLTKTKSEEEEKKINLLLKLDALKMLYPDVKLPTSQPTTNVKQEKIEDSDDDDVVEVVSVKKGIEVICLSDDD